MDTQMQDVTMHTRESLDIIDGDYDAAIHDSIPGSLVFPIDDFGPHPDNARIGDIKMISESLATNGQYVPILTDIDGVIIKGNHTWKAAKELGWTHIAVHRTKATYDESMRLLTADNRLSDLGTYDKDKQAQNLKHLMETGLLVGSGYTADTIDDELAALGAVEEAAGEDEFAGGFAHSEDEVKDKFPSAKNEGGQPSQPMKEMVLMYPTEIHAEVQAHVTKLGKKWGVEASRDIVREALRRQVAIEIEE